MYRSLKYHQFDALMPQKSEFDTTHKNLSMYLIIYFVNSLINNVSLVVCSGAPLAGKVVALLSLFPASRRIFPRSSRSRGSPRIPCANLPSPLTKIMTLIIISLLSSPFILPFEATVEAVYCRVDIDGYFVGHPELTHCF